MTTPDNQAVLALLRMKEHIDRLERARQESIAIVGLAARMPFESQGVAIWEGLTKSVDASTEIPRERWDADASYDADPRAPNKAVTKRASFLSDVAQFDAGFFSIAPVEAQAMDPQQRIVLETAWEALADAGASLPYLRQVRTGVYLGVCVSDYGVLAAAADLPEALAPYRSTGNANSIVAGRVSYVLGLTGPSLVVDTACSSSLVALHLACESLRARTSDVALAGGVTLMLSPDTLVMLSKLGALSVDGRCRAFDAKGSGFGRGEGCGIVVLKRLSDAVRDGDRVLAVVRGSAVNQDGRSDGLTAPNGLSQQEVIRSALAFGKLAPGDVQYVEAHGTGTVLGDPIEVEALTEVFGAAHSKSSPLVIGSLKSNIGHLEAAAGIAGLIKTILCIQHRQLPASLHFQTPNPHIPWEDIPVRVQTKLGPWPEPDKPLVAGVSSFGFSGTNAHALVSEPPAVPADAWKDADRLATEATLLPLCVSAKTPEALRAYAKRFVQYLSSPLEAPATWRDVAFTSSVRRTHLEHRLVVAGKSAADWSEMLASFAHGEMPSGLVTGDATSPVERAVFMFSGQGTQWWGMGRELIEREPIFRATLEECAGYIRRDADWSLLEELGRDEASSRLQRTDIAQPALVSLQMGLVRLLASWGIEPSAVVGHSVGEISAACTAGVLSLEQACHVATVRGRVMHKASGRGKMASVRLSAERAEALSRDFPGRLVVGAYNGPESVVLSGEAEAVASAVRMLDSEGVETKELRVDYAFHSPQMDPFQSELASALASLKPSSSRLPIVSTVTGTAEGATFDGAYWVRQMREPVKFAQAARTLLERGQELFVEVGPHPVLLASVDEIATQSSKRAVLVATLKRHAEQSLCAQQALGALHAAGYPIDWKKFFSVPGRVVSLPSYPWQRERYWLPTPKRSKRVGSDSPWSLIHRHYASSDQPGKHVFELELDVSEGPHAYFADHKVQGGVWLPGAAYLEMALEAASVAFEGKPAWVEGLTLAEAMTLTKAEPALVQLVVQPEQEGSHAFRIASRPVKEVGAPWTQHASGRLVLRDARGAAPRTVLSEIQKRCTREIKVGSLYEDFEAAGLSYGTAFQGLEAAWGGEGEAISKLVELEELTDDVSGYVVHPSLLDAGFQTSAAAVRGVSSGRTYVPATVGRLCVHSKGAPRWAHVTSRSATEEAITTDLVLLDDKGRVVVEVEGLRALALGKATDKLDDWLFEMSWRPSASKVAETAQGSWLLLSDEQGLGAGLRSWLEARGAEVVTVTRGGGFRKKDATHYELDPLSPEAMLRLMKEVFGKAGPKRVVSLFGLDTRATSESPLDED
ncbi:MAG TPA: type I polyketide synthase, partial [Labilithrix sp.]|nr:type I polyketide synthase [Labilithrix sp.]